MFQRLCAVAMFVLALFISVIPNVDARQDIYAFTYNGNNWYVDRDSVDRSKPDGLLHFTVYTMIGLRYDVASGSEYYNADVYYYDQKLSTEGGQLYRNPGILAAARVARQQPDAPKQAPKPVVAQQTASQSIAAQTATQSVAPTAPQPNIVKALSTPVQAPVPANGPVKVNTQIPIVLPTGPVKKVAAKTVMTFHNTSKQTTGTTSESDETEANRTRK